MYTWIMRITQLCKSRYIVILFHQQTDSSCQKPVAGCYNSDVNSYVTKPLNSTKPGGNLALFAYFCRAKKEYSGAKMFRLDKYKFYSQCGW